MSRYLVDQIEAKSNVRVWSGCEVRALEGDEELEAVVIPGCGARSERSRDSAVFAMIGAPPRSEGLVDYVGQDDKGFVAGEWRAATRTSPSTGTGRIEAR